MAEFHGNLDELQERLAPLALDGDWEEKPNGVYRFVCKDRCGINWASTTGKIWFDGHAAKKDALMKRVEPLLADGVAAEVAGKKTIFIVHGRDGDAKDQLELILRRLQLDPYILQNKGSSGDTLIEALERMIGKAATSAFGIVLLTPDDKGYFAGDKPEDAQPRARQNVILEMGMLLSSLTRKRCAILQKGFVEQPSDMHGLVYIPFNTHVREAVPKLVQRLQDAGFVLDPADIAEASS